MARCKAGRERRAQAMERTLIPEDAPAGEIESKPGQYETGDDCLRRQFGGALGATRNKAIAQAKSAQTKIQRGQKPRGSRSTHPTWRSTRSKAAVAKRPAMPATRASRQRLAIEHPASPRTVRSASPTASAAMPRRSIHGADVSSVTRQPSPCQPSKSGPGVAACQKPAREMPAPPSRGVS